MAWHQWRIASTRERIEPIEEQLLSCGCVSITLTDAKDQPLLEPLPGEMPTWDDCIIIGLFESQHDKEALHSHIQQQLIPSETLTYEWLEDQVWERAWMDSFKPMQFGNRLWVIPSHQSPVDETAVNMILDPGLAFGTGTHPTTSLCLQWLDAQTLTNKTVFDFGCGSGVLAIAAALLGAQTVYATDIDPQAEIATLDNAQKNKVEQTIRMVATGESPEQVIDVLVANILAQPLLELCETFAKLCPSGAQLALSGILAEQANDIKIAYQKYFTLAPTQQEEDWVLVSGVRK